MSVVATRQTSTNTILGVVVVSMSVVATRRTSTNTNLGVVVGICECGRH